MDRRARDDAEATEEEADGLEVFAKLDGASADFARGARVGGGGKVGVGAALDEGFAVVEQVADCLLYTSDAADE